MQGPERPKGRLGEGAVSCDLRAEEAQRCLELRAGGGRGKGDGEEVREPGAGNGGWSGWHFWRGRGREDWMDGKLGGGLRI